MDNLCRWLVSLSKKVMIEQMKQDLLRLSKENDELRQLNKVQQSQMFELLARCRRFSDFSYISIYRMWNIPALSFTFVFIILSMKYRRLWNIHSFAIVLFMSFIRRYFVDKSPKCKWPKMQLSNLFSLSFPYQDLSFVHS